MKNANAQGTAWGRVTPHLVFLFAVMSACLQAADTEGPRLYGSFDVGSYQPYRLGADLVFEVPFNERISVKGTRNGILALDLGGVERSAVLSTVGADYLYFTYTVQPWDYAPDGVRVKELTLNAMSIEDAAGNKTGVLDFGEHIPYQVKSVFKVSTNNTGLSPVTSYGVAMEAEENIYVAANILATYRIVVLSKTGEILRTFSSSGSAPGQYNGSASLAMDNAQNLLVSDAGNNRVQVLSRAGTFIRSFGSAGSGDGQFKGPKGICVALDGSVFVVDSGNNRIEVFDAAGNYLRQFGVLGFGPGQFKSPSGIAATPNGNIVVADTGNNRVQILDRNGSFLTQCDRGLINSLPLASPSSVTVDATGDIAVSDSFHLRMFSPDGRFLRRLDDAAFPGSPAAVVAVPGSKRLCGVSGRNVLLFDAAVIPVDGTPRASISNPSVSITRNGPVTYTISYPSFQAVNLSPNDITLVKGGTATGVVSLAPAGTNWLVTIDDISGDGHLGIDVAAGTGIDGRGNSAQALSGRTCDIDNIKPILGMETSATNMTDKATFRCYVYMIDTHEPYFQLNQEDVGLNQTGTATGTLKVVGGLTVEISEISGWGTIGISLREGAAIDTAGNRSAATNFPPLPVISLAPRVAFLNQSTNLTRHGPVTYTLKYGGQGFLQSTLKPQDIVLVSTGVTAAVSVAGSGDTRTITLSDIEGNGSIDLKVLPGTGIYEDSSVIAPGVSALARVEVDNTSPQLSIDAPWTGGFSSGWPITFPVNYSDDSHPLHGLPDVGKVRLLKTGTANGRILAWAAGDAQYVTITNVAGKGSLAIQFEAGAAMDAAGNMSPATPPSQIVEIDAPSPATPKINPNHVLGGSKGPIYITIEYPINVVPTISLTAADVILYKTGTASGTVAVYGNSNERIVVISNITGDGTISFSLRAGTAFDADNVPADAVGPIPPLSIDNTGPAVTIGEPVYSDRSFIMFPVSFSDPWPIDIRLDPTNIILLKTGSADGTVSLGGTASATTRQVIISNLVGIGSLGIKLEPGCAFDASGNPTAESQPSVMVPVWNPLPPGANNPPKLDAIPDVSISEGQAYRYRASASDPDVPANTLTFSVLSGPPGLTIDPITGEINWTPARGQGGQRYVATIQVTDNGTPSLNDAATWTLKVAEANTPPIFNLIADQTIEEGRELVLQASAADPDAISNKVTYSLGAGAPAGMTIDALNGQIRWRPTEADGPGAYNIRIIASDNGVPSLSGQINFKVAVAEVNTSPILSTIADQQVNEGTAIGPINFNVSDPDIPAQAITLLVASSNPALIGSADIELGGSGWARTMLLRPTPGQTGSATITVSASDGEATASAQFVLEVLALKPAILSQSASAVLRIGSGLQLDVSAAGTKPLTYRWFLNDALLPGYTDPLLVIASLEPRHAGFYRVEISNSAGSVISSNMEVTVTVPPEITTGPGSTRVVAGGDAAFRVIATGTPPLEYQWRFNGQAIPGEVTDGLLLSLVTPENEGEYSVDVANRDGVVTSISAKLTVLTKPTIITQPHDQTALTGSAVTFQVGVQGTPPFTYQWRFQDQDIPGATAPTLPIVTTTAASSGEYTVLVRNEAGEVSSAAARLTVQEAASIAGQPQNLTLKAGETARLTVLASGTPPLDYQWRRDGSDIPGANAATFIIPATTTTDEGDYVVLVKNVAGEAVSAAARLTVQEPVTIAQQPASTTRKAGEATQFAVLASGTLPFEYQWRRNGNDIPGANAATFVIPATTTADEGDYVVLVKNVAGEAVSAAARLTVQEPVTIIQQPGSATNSVGETVRFSILVAGTNPLRYQWKHDGTEIPGASSAELNIPSARQTDAGIYQVEVSNVLGSVESEEATLTVQIPPPVRFDAASSTADTFHLTISGPPGLEFAIEASTDLLTWSIVTNSTFKAEPFFFTDDKSVKIESRFYRVISSGNK